MNEGVWRTVNGRRIFIKHSQSSNKKTRMYENAMVGVSEKDLKEQYKASLDGVSKLEFDGEIDKEEYEKAVKNINDTYIKKRNEYHENYDNDIYKKAYKEYLKAHPKSKIKFEDFLKNAE